MKASLSSGIFNRVPLFFPPLGGEVYEAGVWGQSPQETPANITTRSRRCPLLGGSMHLLFYFLIHPRPASHHAGESHTTIRDRGPCGFTLRSHSTVQNTPVCFIPYDRVTSHLRRLASSRAAYALAGYSSFAGATSSSAWTCAIVDQSAIHLHVCRHVAAAASHSKDSSHVVPSRIIAQHQTRIFRANATAAFFRRVFCP